MAQQQAQSVSTATRLAKTLRSRCAQIGVSAWHLAVDGTALAAPETTGVIADMVRTPALRAMLKSAAKHLCEQDRPEATTCELFPGAWAVLVPLHRRRSVESIVAAVILGAECCVGEQFDLLASSGGIDAKLARRAVGESAASLESAHELQRLLSWMAGDLEESEDARSQVADTGRKLAESFEEISLLYRLREGISAETNPLTFTREACEELLEVLPYKWLGVRFARDRQQARVLAGETLLLGDMPCSRDCFVSEVDPMVGMIDPSVPHVMAADECGCLATDGSEAVAIAFTTAGWHLGVMVAGGKQSDDSCVTSTDIKMMQAVANHIASLVENAGLYEDQRDMFLGTLRALTTAIDAKDRYTCGHSERVAYLSELIAKASGLSDKQVERIRISGLVHDIGKIGVSEAVLRKPGRLTDDEYNEIKLHPEIGHNILRDIPQLADVLPGVLYHHERYDGRGYPHGLKGEEIPLMARVIGLADAFDAMSSSRTYRKAMDREHVRNEVRNGAGVQFDPEFAERFLTLDLSEYDAMVERHKASEMPEHVIQPTNADEQRGEAA